MSLAEASSVPAAQKAGIGIDRLSGMLALAVVAVPYNVLSPLVTAALVILLCLPGIAFLCIGRRVNFGLLWVFVAAVLIWTAISLNDPGRKLLLVAHANHFWQYILITFGLCGYLKNLDLVAFLNTPRFRTITAVSSLISIGYQLDTHGNVHEFSPNILYYMMSVFFVSRARLPHVLLCAFIIFVFIVVNNRSSPKMIIALFFLFMMFNPWGWMVKAGALFIVFSPLVIYLTVDPFMLWDLKLMDHNTYIRAEFVRGAFPLLADKPLFGLGFGPSYRPLNFNYLSTHSLLTNMQHLNIVSNHHSVFDTAYRLGMVPAACFVFALFVRPNLKNYSRILKFTMLTLGIGLSLNAWFENQAQMLIVASLSALLLAYGTRKGPVDER